MKRQKSEGKGQNSIIIFDCLMLELFDFDF